MGEIRRFAVIILGIVLGAALGLYVAGDSPRTVKSILWFALTGAGLLALVLAGLMVFRMGRGRW